jgi:hypothetical protein
LGGSSRETKEDCEEVVLSPPRYEATKGSPVLFIPGFYIFGGSLPLPSPMVAGPFFPLASCCCYCMREYSSRRMFIRISMEVLMYSISVVASESFSFFLSLERRSSE